MKIKSVSTAVSYIPQQQQAKGPLQLALLLYHIVSQFSRWASALCLRSESDSTKCPPHTAAASTLVKCQHLLHTIRR